MCASHRDSERAATDGTVVTAVLRNEFAVVQVEIRKIRGGTALSIREPVTGACITLDALEAEALTHADRGVFRALLAAERPAGGQPRD